jgi:hypothetical protein
MEAQSQPAGASSSPFLMAAYLPALRPVSTWFPWNGGNADSVEDVRMAPPEACAFLKCEVNWVSGQAQSKRPWTPR